MTLTLGFVSVIRPAFKGDSPRVARDSLERLRSIGDELGFRVVTADLGADRPRTAGGHEIPRFAVCDAAEAVTAAEQMTAAEVDFLLVQQTTFATGDVMAPLLLAAKRVGLWGVPEAAGAPAPGTNRAPEPGSLLPGGPLPLNSLCGVNMTLSLLDHPAVGREGPVKWFYGRADDEAFMARLRPTIAALRGLRRLSGARILQIGGTAPGFYALEESPAWPDVTVDTRPLEEFFQRIAAVSPRDAAARAGSWAGEDSAVTAEQLGRAARIELALERWAREGEYDALAVRCWPELPERCGSMGCLAMGNVSRTVPAACEGDVMGALSMLALSAMSKRPAILMDLSDVSAPGSADDALLFWHCGNAPLDWAAGGRSRLTTHFNRDGVGVVRDMTLRPGPATGFRLLRGGRQAVIVSGEFAGTGSARFDGVSGWLKRPRWNGDPISAHGVVAGILDNRLPHHLALGDGEMTESLQELCAWLGASVVEPGRADNVVRPRRAAPAADEAESK